MSGGRGLVCRDGYLFKRLRPSLAGFLLVGVAGLPLGIGILLHGFTLLGVAVLLPAVVVMLVGAGVLIRWRLARVSLALLGVAALPAGIVALLDGQTLVGAAILFGGISLRLFGVLLLGGPKRRRIEFRLALAGLPLAIAVLLLGVALLHYGSTLGGVAGLLVAIGLLTVEAATLYRPDLGRRVVAWLTKRNDLPLRVDGNDLQAADGSADQVKAEIKAITGPT